MSDPKVSIILRSFNEGWALSGTLAALPRQNYKNWELIAFDSGSTDGSVDLIRAAQPRCFIQMEPAAYNPPRVMNQGMSLAGSDYCIFLNADATPQDDNWLRPLVTALLDTKTAAVFGRQIPRPDCRAIFAHDYERCFGERRESVRWKHFFSMVSSGVRKDIWAQRGFSEKLQYAEDHEFTWWWKNKGYNIIFCPESVVMHSHNYTPAQAYKRSFGDARALAASWDEQPEYYNWLQTVFLGWVWDVERDLAFCWRQRRLNDFPHAAHIRWKQRRGTLDGFRQGWRDYRLASA
jgi:rhamnosyltransferase